MNVHNKLECFHPSLIFTSKAGASLSEVHQSLMFTSKAGASHSRVGSWPYPRTSDYLHGLLGTNTLAYLAHSY
jgi:hypothetical protein